MDPRYERFQKLVQRLRDKRRGYWYQFEGGATEDAIVAAERELGVGLPPSFRWFLREFGATRLCATIYGVGSGGWRAIPEVTRKQRGAFPRLPHRLVVFGVESWRLARSQGDRLAYTYDCFDTSRDIDGEYPVVVWEPHPLWRRRRREVGVCFLDWLERKLDEAEADELPMEPPNGSGTENWEYYWQRILESPPEIRECAACVGQDRRVLRLLAFLEDQPCRRLLLIGTGISLLPHALAHLGCEVTALDVSSTASRFVSTATVNPDDLVPFFPEYTEGPPDERGVRHQGMDWERSRERIAREHRPGGQVTAIAPDLFTHAPAQPYDLIYVHRVFQSLTAPQQVPMARRFLDWLRPGGICVVQTWSVVWNGTDAVLALEQPFRDAGFSIDHDPHRWRWERFRCTGGWSVVESAREASAQRDEGVPPPAADAKLAVFWHDDL
jgi:hypothetical protein